MSIIQVRKFLEKSGCALFVSIFIGVIFIVGLLTCNPNMKRGGTGPGTENKHPVFSLGQITVDMGTLEEASKRAQSMFGSVEEPQPRQMIDAYETALTSLVRSAVTAELARQKGLLPDRSKLKEELRRQLEGQIAATRSQWIATGKLKADATEKEFQELAQKELGQSIADVKANQDRAIDEALSTEAGYQGLAASMSNSELTKAAAKTIAISDEDLKKSFATLTFKRILIGAKQNAGADPMEIAKKVETELKSGLEFEKAMLKYSNETPMAGKRVDQNEMTMPMSSLVDDPTRAPLAKLQVGGVSEPISSADGVSVYKLVKLDPNVPKDFDKQKEMYRQQQIQQRAQAVTDAQIAEALKTAKIDWKSAGAQALYNVSQARTDTSLDSKARKEKLTSLLNEAESAAASDNVGSRLGVFAQFVASDELWTLSSQPEREQSVESRIKVLQSALDVMSDPGIRLQLADAFLVKKDKEAAAQALVDAAKDNVTVGPVGQMYYQDISRKLVEFKGQGILSDGQTQEIKKELDRWVTDSEQRKKEDAERKKIEEEDRKAAEQERLKAEAEDKKNQPIDRKELPSGQKPGATGTTTGGSQPTTASTAGTAGGAKSGAPATSGDAKANPAGKPGEAKPPAKG